MSNQTSQDKELPQESTIEHRLWRAGHAWSAFQCVVDVCDYILANRIQPNAEIYYPLGTAISVLYGRPFKHSEGIEKLTLDFVPKQFHYLHHQLILGRDQTTAHVDSGALFEGRAANGVQLFVRNNGNQVALGMSRPKFKTTAIWQIRDLANALVKRMLDEIRNVVSEYPDDLPDGDYEIDLTTGNLRRS